MPDIFIFICGATVAMVFFILGFLFGVAYTRATDAKFTTPDGLITFDLNKLLEFEEQRLDKQAEEQANNDIKEGGD